MIGMDESGRSRRKGMEEKKTFSLTYSLFSLFLFFSFSLLFYCLFPLCFSREYSNVMGYVHMGEYERDGLYGVIWECEYHE